MRKRQSKTAELLYDNVLEALETDKNVRIGQVNEMRGNSQFVVRVVVSTRNDELEEVKGLCKQGENESQVFEDVLAELPHKLRKVSWVKKC